MRSPGDRLAFAVVTLLSAILLILSGAAPALAFNESEDLAVLYVRLNAGATALDTEFVIGNDEGSAETANVKCFNENGLRVGPAAGTDVALGIHDAEVVTQEHLAITTDPNYTGLGWCFVVNKAGTGSGDLGVTAIIGLQGAGLPADASRPPASRILGSNASSFVATDVGQGMYSTHDGSISYWTRQASWLSFLLAINPRQAAGTLDLTVYNMAGGVEASFTGAGALPFPARAMALRGMPGGSSTATAGHADLNVNGGARLLGYVFGANLASSQAILHQIALDEDDTLRLDDLEITRP